MVSNIMEDPIAIYNKWKNGQTLTILVYFPSEWIKEYEKHKAAQEKVELLKQFTALDCEIRLQTSYKISEKEATVFINTVRLNVDISELHSKSLTRNYDIIINPKQQRSVAKLVLRRIHEHIYKTI